MKNKLALGLGGMVLLGGVALAWSAPQEGARRHERGERIERSKAQHSKGERGGEARRGLRERLRMRVERARERMRSLEVTESQRELARNAARDLAPVAEDLRPKARAIVERARALRRSGDVEGARAILRSELRPLLESAAPHAERACAPIARSLTPEQRAKLEAAAKRRGETFDEQRFTRRLGLVLGSRRAQERLRAKGR